jgi:hypothetical protein
MKNGLPKVIEKVQFVLSKGFQKKGDLKIYILLHSSNTKLPSFVFTYNYIIPLYIIYLSLILGLVLNTKRAKT